LTLGPPPAYFSTLRLVEWTPPRPLIRISNYGTGEPHFGRKQVYRFDSPDGSFGTCYAGFSLSCAFAETVLHDRSVESDGRIHVAHSILDRKWVVMLEHSELRLAVMRGAHLLTAGGDGELSTIQPYGLTQEWAKAVHDHPQTVDGFVYTSRRLNNAKAVVLFERAEPRINASGYREFLTHPGRPAIRAMFKIKVT
jgi:hypothetical protein